MTDRPRFRELPKRQGRKARALQPVLERVEDRTLLAVLLFGDAALGSTVTTQSRRQTVVLDGLDGTGLATKDNKLDVPGYSYALLSSDRPEDQSGISLGITSRGGFSFKSLQVVSQSVHLESGTSAPVTVTIAAGPDERKGDAVTVSLDFSFQVIGFAGINAYAEAKYGAGYTYQGVTTKLKPGAVSLDAASPDGQSDAFDVKIGDTLTLYIDDVE